MIDFVLPQTLGEWLAWLTAFATLLVGLAMMLAPRVFLSFVGLAPVPDRRDGLSETRSFIGGGTVGLALAVLLLHPQPLLYFALGMTFALMVVGRVLSLIVDRATGKVAMLGLAIEIAAAFFPFAYTFGLIV